MQLNILEQTPLTQLVEQQLRKQHLTEAGMPVQRNAGVPVFLTEELSGVSERFAGTHEHGGVLVIGARSRLEKNGVLQRLLATRLLDARHIAGFGVRRWYPEEQDFVRTRNVQIYSMIEISREGLTEMTDAVMTYVRNWSAFHVIVCLDAVDPAFAPGLRDPCAGGFTSRELLYVLQRLRLIKSLASVEIVLDAEADVSTALLVSQLIAEL